VVNRLCGDAVPLACQRSARVSITRSNWPCRSCGEKSSLPCVTANGPRDLINDSTILLRGTATSTASPGGAGRVCLNRLCRPCCCQVKPSLE